MISIGAKLGPVCKQRKAACSAGYMHRDTDWCPYRLSLGSWVCDTCMMAWMFWRSSVSRDIQCYALWGILLDACVICNCEFHLGKLYTWDCKSDQA